MDGTVIDKKDIKDRGGSLIEMKNIRSKPEPSMSEEG